MPKKRSNYHADSRRDGISISKRPSGSWQARVWDSTLRRYKNKSFATETDAVEWSQQTAARLTLRQTSATRPMLSKIGEDYALGCDHAGQSASHVQIIRNIISRAASAGIDDLEDPNIIPRCSHFIKNLTACRHGQRTPRPATPRTKNRALMVLRSIGNYAVISGKITRNPFLAVKRATEKQRIRLTFRITELRQLVSDEHSAHPAWILAVLATYTGQRSETLRHITWEMIDFKRRRIVIPSEILKQDVPVRAPLQTELANILEPMRGVGRGTVIPADVMPRNSDHANEIFQRYLRHCGVPYEGRGLHALRHTAASLLTATGMSMGSVMDAIGHTQTQTARHYSMGAADFRDEVKAEGWPEGDFRIRRGAVTAMDITPNVG